MSEHLAWVKGGTASFLTIADDAVTLRSSVSSPPGSRLDATLLADPAVTVKVKVHTSKLQPDGSFALKGRLLEASRVLRDRLLALVAPASA